MCTDETIGQHDVDSGASAAGADGVAEGDAPVGGGSCNAVDDDTSGGSGDAEGDDDFFVRNLDSDSIAMRRDLAKFPGEFKTTVHDWRAWRDKKEASTPLHAPISAVPAPVRLHVYLRMQLQ